MIGREKLPLLALGVGAVVVAGSLVVLVAKVGKPPPVADGAAAAAGAAAVAAAGDRTPRRAPSLSLPPPGPGGEPQAEDVAPAKPPPTLPMPGDMPRDAPASAEPAADGEREAMMREATEFYDKGDYEPAAEKALAVLAHEPDNVRMLRVATSSSCFSGDVDKARELYGRLPKRDQRDIARRCAKVDIKF